MSKNLMSKKDWKEFKKKHNYDHEIEFLNHCLKMWNQYKEYSEHWDEPLYQEKIKQDLFKLDVLSKIIP